MAHPNIGDEGYENFPGECDNTDPCFLYLGSNVTDQEASDMLADGGWCYLGSQSGVYAEQAIIANAPAGYTPEEACDWIKSQLTEHYDGEDRWRSSDSGDLRYIHGYEKRCDWALNGATVNCGVTWIGDDPIDIGGQWRVECNWTVTIDRYAKIGDPVCDPGYIPIDGKCERCDSTFFEILYNTNFASLTNETTADSWESQDVLYNQTSQSDFVPVDLNNIAHFGDHTCEYIKQPLTIGNGEYRYNNTITLKIEFSYIDVRTATPDSKIVINLGGEIEIFDIDRIKTELTGDGGLYSYGFGGAIAYIEFPAPAVNPGEFAIAEMWQMGDIILEVIQFGILGYDPCIKTELYDIEATDAEIECTTVPVPPCIPQYLYNQDLYRRQIVTFKTDIQGLIPQYLDKIMISHSALQWGEAGQVAVRDIENLTLSENLVDLTDGKTIVFRDINGDISGAYGVGILDEYNIQVPGMPEWVTVNTFYTIQEMATAKEFLVISVRPSGDDVTIECVNYDENIYKDGGC